MTTLYEYDIRGRFKDYLFPISFRFSDAGGTPAEIGGYEFYIELRNIRKSVIYFKLGDGLSVSGNELVWEFGSELSIAPDAYSYAVKIVHDDKPLTVIAGEFIVEPEKVRRNV